MDGIFQLDLITQRVLSAHIKNLTDELARALAENEVQRKRIAELEAPPPAETKADA